MTDFIAFVNLLNEEATKKNILAALRTLAGHPLPKGVPTTLSNFQQVQPEDAVFVYFAGHRTAASERFYLIPHDLGYSGARDALDESGLQTLLQSSISDQELEQAFENIDADRLTLIIDACNSGQALEAEEKRRGPMNSKGLAQLAYEKGMYILTAAQGYQAALELAKLGHGLLTFILVEEGLNTPLADIAPKDGRVVLREWLDYGTDRVLLLQQYSMEQAQSTGRDISIVDGEQIMQNLRERTLQHPRVFYSREPPAQPLVIAEPGN